MEELIYKVARKIDNQITFKKIFPGIVGSIFEAIDGRLINAALVSTWNRMNQEESEIMETLCKAYLSDNFSLIEKELVVKLNEAIDLPKMNEKDENVLLNGIVKAIFTIIEGKRENFETRSDIGQGPPDDDPD